MSWKVPLSRLTLTKEQREAVNRVLDSGWLTMGPETEACEEEWRAVANHRHAVLVSSGTSALWLALAALGVGPGDEVIVPSLTFVADANVVVRLGARPVFADVEGVHRPVVDAAAVQLAVTARTRAVVAVHYGGHLADVAGIRRLVPNIPIVVDAAHAAGPLASGLWPGAEGDAACFSFFSNKNLGVGEGGLVSTADGDLAECVRLLRSHGIDRDTWRRHRGKGSAYDVITPGMNHRPSEISAALVRSGLAGLPAENQRRREHIVTYRAHLGEVGVAMPFDDGEETAAHLAVAVFGPKRDGMRAALADAGIQTSVHYLPIHRLSWYRHRTAVSLPNTEAAGDAYLTLPLWGAMSASDRDTVVAAVATASRS